jgi:hypothetical protein
MSERKEDKLQDRLDDVEDDIQAARRRIAEEKDKGPEYHESGSIRPDLDDQTIVPPG